MGHTTCTLIVSALGLLASWVAPRLSAHELTDGELERWTEVVVRDDVIQLRFSIGFNEATTESIVDLVAAAAESAPDGEPKARQPVGELPPFEQDLIVYVSSHVTLEVDGEAQRPSGAEARRSGRHPMCWFVELTFDAPPSETEFTLAVRDEAFPAMPGQSRQAIRSKSNWELLDANAAPLVVRAQPVVLVTSGDGPKSPPNIEGRFGTPEPKTTSRPKTSPRDGSN
jgi:hypothetical protein